MLPGSGYNPKFFWSYPLYDFYEVRHVWFMRSVVDRQDESILFQYDSARRSSVHI